jgi:hypothetical protein
MKNEIFPLQAAERTPWLNTAIRAVLALFGAYGLAWLATGVFALVLPLSRIEAAQAAVMLGFVVQALAAMWSIAASNLLRALCGLALPAALLGLSLLCLLGRGAQ